MKLTLLLFLNISIVAYGQTELKETVFPEYSILLPKDWKPIQESFMDTLHELNQHEQRTYIIGLENPNASKTPFPYIVVQFIEITQSKKGSDFNKTIEQFKETYKKGGVHSKFIVDKENARFYLEFTKENIPVFNSLIFGENGIVEIGFYADISNKEQNFELFKKIYHSVKLNSPFIHKSGFFDASNLFLLFLLLISIISLIFKKRRASSNEKRLQNPQHNSMSTFRTIVAIFQASFPFIGFFLLALIAYAKLPPYFNIISTLIILTIGYFISRMVFQMMMRRGVISTMSGSAASPELDDLEPSPDSDIQKLSPNTLAAGFTKKTLEFNKEMTVSIWGDWNGRKLNTKQEIRTIKFNKENEILEIQLSNNCLIKIKRPKHIFYTTNYLKVVHAKEILWQVAIDKYTKNQYSYLDTGKEIKTQSNTNWKPHKYDVGKGMNALYLQG